MKTNEQPGFTLPVVLVSLTGMLILLGALLTIVNLERQTATAHVNIFQADLAAESALTEVRSLLAQETSNDEYFVFNAPLKVDFDDNDDGTVSDDEMVERDYPFLARQKSSGDGGVSFDYVPLFSTEGVPDQTTYLEKPADPALPTDDAEKVSLSALPWKEPAVLAWRYIRDADEKPVARYAYWVEDTEAYIDPKLVNESVTGAGSEEDPEPKLRANSRWPRGSGKGTWEWPANWPVSGMGIDDINADYPPPWPAPGLNPHALDDEPRLDQIALYTLGDPAAYKDGTDFDDKIESGSLFANTRDSLMAAFGVETPMTRDEFGRLENQASRELEMNLVAGNESYEEQALVPPVEGIRAGVVGTPKLNLNELLSKPRAEAVDEFKQKIVTALPNFETIRKGGFPDDYLATLAANTFDYADIDDEGTVEFGSHRGLDNYPLVTEYLATITWEWLRQPTDDEDAPITGPLLGKSFFRRDGRTYVLFSVEIFAELWNMTSKPVSGSFESNFELTYEFSVDFSQLEFDDPEILGRGISLINSEREQSGSMATPALKLDEESGEYFFAPESVDLEPNEFKLIRLGLVRYMFDVGPEDAFILEPIGEMDPNPVNYAGSFKFKWEKDLVDWSRGGMDASDFSKPRRIFAGGNHTHCLISGTYGMYGEFWTGMGDPRMNYYADLMLSENSYPSNYSPNRRNIRYGTIYSSRNHGPDAIYGRVMPSEWPDGGHDSTFDLSGFHDKSSKALRPDSDDLIDDEPDDIESRKAPLKLSSLGRFFSETELGNIYDPIMWDGSGRVSGATERQWVAGIGRSFEPLDHRTSIASSRILGGGNTLRIGRPEHERFATEPTGEERPEAQAARLLDLFHCGDPFSSVKAEREGPLVVREGHVNINTAPLGVLRALLAGEVASDPDTAIRDKRGRHDERRTLTVRTTETPVNPPRKDLEDPRTEEISTEEANMLAEAVIRGRPYASVSEVSRAKLDHDDNELTPEVPVFGNSDLIPNGSFLNWTDSAAEEMFARLYNSSTVRSRNFKVHAIGQAVRELPDGSLQVQSTRRKEYKIFAKPEGRDAQGSLKDGSSKIEIIYEKGN